MSAPPVFIVGCDRSGTTLLRLMLMQSPELHIPQESGFLGRLRKRQAVYDNFAEAYQRWFFLRDLQMNEATSKTRTFPVFDLTVHEAETALAGAAPTDFAGASAALFEASAQKQGKPRWGDKTPRYVLHLGWLAKAFPQAQFVHLIRDGRAVAGSIRRAHWKPNTRAGAAFWKERVAAGREAGARLSPVRYREIRYEALVTHPTATLQEICEWLALSYTPAMLAFHKEGKSHVPDEHATLFDLVEQPVDPSRAYAWRDELSEREIADAEDVAGDLLADLGYELTGARLPRWVRGLRTLHRATPPFLPKLRGFLNRIGLR